MEIFVKSSQAAGSRRRVVVLGSTGSIGTSCLKVIERLPDRLEAFGLSAHSRWENLLGQTHRYQPRYVTATDPQAAHALSRQTLPGGTRLLYGDDAIGTMVSDPAVDVAIPGRKYSFGVVEAAEARGDFEVLVQRKRRALRIHLGAHVAAGLVVLKSAMREALA